MQIKLFKMLRRCSVLRELLSNRPHVEKLWEFVDRVFKQKGDEVEFIVLYWLYGERQLVSW